MELANHLDMVVMVMLVLGCGGDDGSGGGDVDCGGNDLLNHLETLPKVAPLRSWNY